MKTLPNGITVFNATPHVIRFWREDWGTPVEVESDKVISAEIVERVNRSGFTRMLSALNKVGGILVTPCFVGTDEGKDIARRAYDAGADLVVGSIIAAQAYPRLVAAMTPVLGYERVPLVEKRMRPDKFTAF